MTSVIYIYIYIYRERERERIRLCLRGLIRFFFLLLKKIGNSDRVISEKHSKTKEHDSRPLGFFFEDFYKFSVVNDFSSIYFIRSMQSWICILLFTKTSDHRTYYKLNSDKSMSIMAYTD
jgi:hypothetical protein